MNGTKSRFVALDSLRGVCAILVAVHNLEYPQAPTFVKHASLFVDFFFVLSGFVITHAYMSKLGNRSEFAAFVVRRFGRLWPLHIVLLAAFAVLETSKPLLGWLLHVSFHIAAFQPPNAVWALVDNVLLIQAIGVHTEISWNVPSWSISTEFWTYLLFGGICVLRSLPSAILVGAGGLLAAAVLAASSPAFLESNTYCALLRCIYGFSVGHLTYRAWMSTQSSSVNPGLAEWLLILIVGIFVGTVGAEPLSMLAPLVFGVAVWVFAHEGGTPSNLLKTPLFIQLGLWSYSIYMVHWLVRNVLAQLLRMTFGGRQIMEHQDVFGAIHNKWFMGCLIVGYVLVVVGVAAITFHFVEQPARRYFNRLSNALRRKEASALT